MSISGDKTKVQGPNGDHAFDQANSTTQKNDIILVVGACAWDRLLTVEEYPQPDAKVRSTSFYEGGGGNAANSAHAMALLLQSPSRQLPKVYLGTCIGADAVGQEVQEELSQAGVDLTGTPLFVVAPPNTTTSITTILVEQANAKKHPTRTCIFTYGSCGELSLEYVRALDANQIFAGVKHFHSDSRHTDVALYLAQAAHERNIPISVDVEKDRKSCALDQLLPLVDILFTNASQIEAYFSRLQKEQLAQQQGHPEDASSSPLILYQNNLDSNPILQESLGVFLVHILQPSMFFTRWFPKVGKQIVITQGHLGAVHVSCDEIKTLPLDSHSSPKSNSITLSLASNERQEFQAMHAFYDSDSRSPSAPQKGAQLMMTMATYTITMVGISNDVDHPIVDTTGAGDAFLAAYLVGLYNNSSWNCLKRLQFAAWVAGRKLGGPGARSALPNDDDVQTRLGSDGTEIRQSLSQHVGNFRFPFLLEKD